MCSDFCVLQSEPLDRISILTWMLQQPRHRAKVPRESRFGLKACGVFGENLCIIRMVN